MCVYIYIHICVFMYVCVSQAHTYTYAHTFADTYTNTLLNIFGQERCKCIHTCVCLPLLAPHMRLE